MKYNRARGSLGRESPRCVALVLVVDKGCERGINELSHEVHYALHAVVYPEIDGSHLVDETHYVPTDREDIVVERSPELLVLVLRLGALCAQHIV